MRGVNVASGRVVMPGWTAGAVVGAAPAGRAAGAGVGVLTGCGGTGVGAGRLATGTGVGGGAAYARVETALADTTSVSAQTPNAASRTGGRYTFAICEMHHV